MLKRMRYIILATVIGLTFTVGSSIGVSASSPIFYQGNVTWGIGRRDTSVTEDFNYGTLTESVPRFGSLALIDTNLCGIPGNKSTTVYNNIPAFIAVNSPELVANGGYCYVGFCFAYCTLDPWGNSVSFSPSAITQRLSRAGSLAYSQGQNSVPLTRDRNNQTTRMSNSTFAISPNGLAVDIPDIYPEGFTRPDGANFPKQAYFGYNLSGYVQNDYTFFNYGDTSGYWARTYFFSCRITVPSGYAPDGYNTVWIDLSNALTSNFQSQVTNLLFSVNGQPVATSGYECSCVYLCPVFCFATSYDSYDSVEDYLEIIVAQLGNYQQPPQSVLESYAALGSEAREAAESAAAAMQQAFPTYDPSAMDVSNIIDPDAKAQFSQTMSFLGNRKILPIIGAVFTLCLIAFVFFGKK